MTQSADNRLQHIQKLLIRDIHDGLGGIATNICFMATLARNEINLDKKNDWIEKLQGLSEDANREIRELMNSLEYTTMTWLDVMSSIRRNSSAIFDDKTTDVNIDIEGTLPNDEPELISGMSIVRMAREAMNNIAKHAAADQVDIALHFSDNDLRLRVGDNGCGFNPDTVSRGRGLNNLEKRTVELNGSCRITAFTGTQLEIIIPLPLQRRDASMTEQDSIQ